MYENFSLDINMPKKNRKQKCFFVWILNWMQTHHATRQKIAQNVCRPNSSNERNDTIATVLSTRDKYQGLYASKWRVIECIFVLFKNNLNI